MSELPVAHPWFHAEDAGEGVTRLWEPFVHVFLESNVWHLPGRDADLIVDAANGVGPLRPVTETLTDGRPVIAVATHGHFDHVGGLHEYDDRRAHPGDHAITREPFPLRLRREDLATGTEEMFAFYGFEVTDVLVDAVPSADFDLADWVSPGAEPTASIEEGDVLDLGDRRCTVLHTPGHTAGSVSVLEERTGLLFSGDAIYADARLEWEDAEAMIRSLVRLRDLAPSVRRVFPGHDRTFDGAELATLATAWIERVERGAPGVEGGEER